MSVLTLSRTTQPQMLLPTQGDVVFAWNGAVPAQSVGGFYSPGTIAPATVDGRRTSVGNHGFWLPRGKLVNNRSKGLTIVVEVRRTDNYGANGAEFRISNGYGLAIGFYDWSTLLRVPVWGSWTGNGDPSILMATLPGNQWLTMSVVLNIEASLFSMYYRGRKLGETTLGVLDPVETFDPPGATVSNISNERSFSMLAVLPGVDPARAAALSVNPWQLFTPIDRQIWIGLTDSITVTPQFPYSPSSDITTTGWTATPAGGFYSTLDEVAYDDADYITSPDLASPTPITMGLPATMPAGTYNISIRAKYTGTSGQVKATLLNDANEAQGASGWQAILSSAGTYELLITTTGDATRIKLEVQS